MMINTDLKKKLLSIFIILLLTGGVITINSEFSTTYAGGWGGSSGGDDDDDDDETVHACKCCCPNCIDPASDCSSACACQSNAETYSVDLGRDIKGTNGFDVRHMVMHQEWLIKNLWEAHILPAMMLMAQQMTVTAMQQVEIIGTFFDAKHQLESQRLLQSLQAQAHKDYHPSEGMCRFGTNTRSLAAADRNNEFNHIALAARSTQRNLANYGAIGTRGRVSNIQSRLAQFRSTYCNPKDFGNALDLLCSGAPKPRLNRDVNYTNSTQDAETLLIDFTNEASTPDEEDILALSANLYGHNLLSIPEIEIADKNGNIIDSGANAYMKTRALAAKRSVAFNSFAAQTAMKSEGENGVTPYMIEILENMGIKLPSIAVMLTGRHDPSKTNSTTPISLNDLLTARPSYNMQMEILTKKLYQHPNFYSDLYDKPANVDRKDTSMQAIALMQKRDMYRSQLRNEANMAVWLETLLEDIQNDEGNEATKLKETDETIRGLGL